MWAPGVGPDQAVVAGPRSLTSQVPAGAEWFDGVRRLSLALRLFRREGALRVLFAVVDGVLRVEGVIVPAIDPRGVRGARGSHVGGVGVR